MPPLLSVRGRGREKEGGHEQMPPFLSMRGGRGQGLGGGVREMGGELKVPAGAKVIIKGGKPHSRVLPFSVLIYFFLFLYLIYFKVKVLKFKKLNLN